MCNSSTCPNNKSGIGADFLCQCKKRTVIEIENEMRELYPEKELAYIDYTDNAGSRSHADRFWNNYKCLQRKWNSLVQERHAILNPSDQGEEDN